MTATSNRLGGIALDRPRIARRPLAWLALGALVAGAAAVAVFAASGPSSLVPQSTAWFPDWLAGPLRGLFGHLPNRAQWLNDGLSALVVAMLLPYAVVLWGARSLSMRAIAVFAIASAAILALSPPLRDSDMFNYLGYARLGALHHLNPYTHVIAAEPLDPVSQLATWHNWHSPYGPLFTALSYPLGLISLPAAYWTLKVATVLLSLALVWLVYRCAVLLGRDPRLPVLLVAANPVYLIGAVGEFHNDFFMLVASMAAIALLLSGRHRSAGVAMAVAIGVKYTMILLLPFVFQAAWQRRATRRVLVGVALGLIPLAVMSIALFGFTFPNVGGQSRLVTDLSIPNLLGWGLGLGGAAPWLVRDLNAVVVAVVAYQLLRRRNWLSGAGWATVALLATLGWLMPWYVVWLLPLAAIAPSARLRGVALAATVYVAVTFVPVTVVPFLKAHGIDPLGSPVGRAAHAFQWHAQGPAWPTPRR